MSVQPGQLALDTMEYRRGEKYTDKEHFRTDSVSYVNVREKQHLRQNAETK